MAVRMNRIQLVAAALAGGAFTAFSASAVDFNWNVAGPADWNVGTNWDPEGPPTGGGGNHAFINNGGTAEISADIADIQDIFVGAGAETSGTLNQTAGSTFQGTGSWMFVGQDGGTGTYNLSGGTANKERLYIGRNAGGNGTLNLSGTGVVGGGLLIVGVGGGVGTVNMTGGGSVQTTGNAEFANAAVSITDDASVLAGGEVWVGNGDGNSSTLDMNSGMIETSSWVAIGRDSSTGVANLSGDALLRTLDGGEEQKRFITIGGLGANTDTGGTLNISENAVIDAATGIVLSETAGRHGVVNQTGGSVTVHDYVTTQEGFGDSLDVDFSASGEGQYNLMGGVLNAETIDDPMGGFNMTGGVLSATHFKGNLVQDGGTTSPGNSPGTMTVTGNYSLNSGDLFMEIEGTGAGIGYDQLIVTGDVSLSGELTLAGAYVPAFGDVFVLIDNQGANAVSGAFTGLPEGSIVSFNGVDLTLTYLGGDGNDVALVPEPTSLALLSLAGLGLVRRRRR